MTLCQEIDIECKETIIFKSEGYFVSRLETGKTSFMILIPLHLLIKTYLVAFLIRQNMA